MTALLFVWPWAFSALALFWLDGFRHEHWPFLLSLLSLAFNGQTALLLRLWGDDRRELERYRKKHGDLPINTREWFQG